MASALAAKHEAGAFQSRSDFAARQVGGERAGFFVVDMRESSQVAEIAERFFFGLNAKIEMTPVMNADDLQKALTGVQGTIQRYG